MQFSTMRSEVAAQLGLDPTDSGNQTLINRWLNITQQDIASRWPWQFMFDREVVQTVADKIAGTVSIASGSTSVVGVGTSFASTDVGSFIQFQGSNDWYKLTVVGSATTATIEAPFTETTNLSAGTYIIRKFFYSLSANADAIIDAKNWQTPLKLIETDIFTIDDQRPNPQSTGNATSFIAFGYDSSGNIRFSPYPFPSDVRNIEFRTLKRLVDMALDTDISIIPTKWHHVVIYGANWLGWAYKNDKAAMIKFWKGEYEEKILDMKFKERISEDTAPVLRAVDDIKRTQFIRMPDGFPVLR